MDLFDFVTAGPKMRKWYGEEMKDKSEEGGKDAASDQQPQQAAQQAPQQVEAEPCDVLVTDGESSMGEQLVLQLILARSSLRVMVRDVAAARAGFGPYIDPVSVDIGSASGLGRAVRSVRSVAAIGRLGALPAAAKKAGVQRLVLLSSAGMPQLGGLAALFSNKEDAVLREPAREEAVAASGLEWVVIKTGPIRDAPGGASALTFSPGRLGGSSGAASGQGISREDLAAVVAAALAAGDELPSGTVIEVAAGGAGAPGDIGAALRQAAAAASVAS